MKYKSLQRPSNISSLKNLGVYTSALEVFTLSRKLTIHNDTPTSIKRSATSLEDHLLFEQITSNAISLPSSIAEATVTKDFSKKMYFQRSISHRLDRIKKACKQLKTKQEIGEIDRVSKALQRFEKKYRIWSLQLTQQN